MSLNKQTHTRLNKRYLLKLYNLHILANMSVYMVGFSNLVCINSFPGALKVCSLYEEEEEKNETKTCLKKNPENLLIR